MDILQDSNEGEHINPVGPLTPTLVIVLSGYGQERWYSDWTWTDEMVYCLDL